MNETTTACGVLLALSAILCLLAAIVLAVLCAASDQARYRR